MLEQQYEQTLAIATAGNQRGFTDSLHHNRYEPTPYELLDLLFQQHQLSSNAQLVDVGCGKGRLNFYIHHVFGIKSVGIEMNPVFYAEALENKKRYGQKHQDAETMITFYHGLAQEYQITSQDTVFYFFNPFSVQVFIAFINQLLRSVEEAPRQLEVILFFASQDYQEYLETRTPFHFIKEVPLPDFYKNPRERFLIYQLPKLD